MNIEKPTALDVKVNERFGRILNKFKILYYDWEADKHGYIVNDGNKNIIITTNHGKLLETGVDYLKHKIKEYQDAIDATNKAIEIFKDEKN